MNKNKSLHQLIHSLSTNEKRFFKMYASRHAIKGENKYVKLFRVFEKIKSYDEKAIDAAIAKADFIKYFSAEKNYLYNLLLDCLDIYHRETSIDRQISKMINTGRVLLEKKLDAQAASILRKAKKLSELHDRQENVAPINYLLKLHDFGNEAVSVDSLKRFHSEEKASLQELGEKQKYQQAFEKLLLHRRLYGIAGDKSALKYIVDDFPHLEKPIPEDFSSFGIRTYFMVSRLEYCRITRNKEEGSFIANSLIQNMEANPKQIAGEYIELYIYTLYIFVVGRYYQNTREAFSQLKKLRHLEKYVSEKVTTSEQARCVEYYVTSITDLWLEKKDYWRIRGEIDDIKKALVDYAPYLNPAFVLSMHFNIACLYFGAKEYREALKWTNKVRNTNSRFREDIFYDLRTLDLIIHYELGNHDILPSLFKSATYFHKHSSHKVGLQTVMIRSLEKLIHSNDKKKLQAIFKDLRKQLIIMKDDPQENRFFHDVDLIAWVSEKCGESVVE